jgi:hypothetical protein
MIAKRPIWKEVVVMSVGLAIVVTGVALTAASIPMAGVPLIVIGAVVAGLAYMEITCKRR